jgi:hypothetical protein
MLRAVRRATLDGAGAPAVGCPNETAEGRRANPQERSFEKSRPTGRSGAPRTSRSVRDAARSLFLVLNHIIPNARKVAPPRDNARESEVVPKFAGRAAPTRSGDDAGGNPGECAKKCLKSVSAPRANQEVQMISSIGELIDPHGMALRETSHSLPNRDIDGTPT